MNIVIHPHAALRARERGATLQRLRQTVQKGRATPAKFGRTRFVSAFAFDKVWNKKHYPMQRIEAFATTIPGGWLVVTVIVKYY